MNRAALKVANDDDGEVIGYIPISLLPRKGDTIGVYSKKICRRPGEPVIMVVDDVFWEVDFDETDVPPEDDIAVSVWAHEEHGAMTIFCVCTGKENDAAGCRDKDDPELCANCGDTLR